MSITLDVINNYFADLILLPNGNVFSKEGFGTLADWSEHQDWWQYFATSHCLEADWRASYMGDPYCFALTLFRFVHTLNTL
jgi:hypothetical protein